MQAIVDVVAARDGQEPGVFVVGGTVRDILLGEKGADIDLAVEGDAISFAYVLADALGGRVTPHPTFGTAIVSYADGERIDVVTTRRESYRLAWSSSHGRARRARSRSAATGFHDERDGCVARARRPRFALRSVRRSRRSRERRGSRAPRRVVRGRPDADPARHHVRGAVRISVRRAHRSARSLLHRVRTRRRPVVVTPTGRIGRTARRSWSPGRNPPTRRARCRLCDSSASPRRRRGGCAVRALDCAAGRARARCAVVASRTGGTRAGDDRPTSPRTGSTGSRSAAGTPT